MIKLNVEMGSYAPFRYVGGQEEAISIIRDVVNQEIEGSFAGRKLMLLIKGGAGSGKTNILKETARLLNGPLVLKSVNDLRKTGAPTLLDAFEGGYLETKKLASESESKRAVYGFESFNTLMRMGDAMVTTDCMTDLLINMSEDYKGGVLFVATTYDSEELLTPIRSRFAIVKLQEPNETNAVDIFIKGMERLSMLEARTDLFADIEEEHALELAQRAVTLGWSQRDITQFLRGCIARNKRDPIERPMDYSFLYSKMPPAPVKRFGL